MPGPAGGYFGGAAHPGPRYETEPAPAVGRTEEERDVDRVLYSSAFQRLAGITQVASPEAGQIFHNRLTHSQKVSQIAFRLARRLKATHGLSDEQISPDAAQAAGLAHDLGHPPFGHVAEQELQRLSEEYGYAESFEGNAQSFRVVNVLALRSLNYRGLNLTRRTLNAVLKYPWQREETGKHSEKWGAYKTETDLFLWVRHGLAAERRAVEAEIMDWADDVTYAVHDMEDFFRAGLVPLDRLAAMETERERFLESFIEPAGGLRGKFLKDGLDFGQITAAIDFLFSEALADIDRPYNATLVERVRLRERTSWLIGRYVVDAVVAELDADGPHLVIDPNLRAEVAVLKELAWYYVINRPSLAIVQAGQRRIIGDLWTIYHEAAANDKEWRLFPSAQRELLPEARDHDNLSLIVIDQIASLTETMAYELHRRLTGVEPGSILDAAAISSR